MKLVKTAARMLFLPGLMWGQATLAAATDSRGLCPAKWTVFGPVVQDNTFAPGGSPRRSMLLSGENMKAIPSKLEINGKVYQARQLDCPPGQAVDFDALTEHNPRGATIYLFAVIEAPEMATLRMGAGADWWMQWWLNGQPVFDTLDDGNKKSPIRADNHVFDLALKQGENILAAAIVRGSASFAFAAGNPNSCRHSSAYDEAMRWSCELLAHGGFFVKGAIDFKALREAYEMAVRAAENYDQKFEALRRLAEARLNDPRDDDYEGIRGLFRVLEALAEVDVPGGGAPVRHRAVERGRAVLGIGMAYLAEGRASEARQEFDRVEIARFGEIGGVTPPDDVCGMTASLLQDAAYQRAWSYIHDRRYTDAQRELDKILDMEGVSERSGIGLRARQARETLRQLPRLRHDRPRMFFNADSWPCVMERALSGERSHFDAMRARVAGYAPDSPNIFDSWEGKGASWANQPEEWGMRAMEAAFVYRVTRDQATLARVRRMLRATMDYFLSRTVTRCRSYPRIAFMAALDWVWDALPPSERESLRADLLEYVYTLHCEDKMVGQAGHYTSYYERNVYRYAGMFIIDDDLNDVAHTRALEILSRDAWLHVYGGDIKLRLEEGLTGHLTHGLVDYNTAEGQNELWPVLHMWESALGKRIPPELVHVVSPGFILRNALGFNPGLLHFGYSRSWRKADGQPTQLLYDHLARSMYFFSATSPEQAAIARHLRERISREGVGGGAGQFPVFPFLIDIAAAPPAAIPPGMPIARHFEIGGVILMSSGFSLGDTYALYSGGASRSEAHFDTTHFTIYKKGWLALDSGTRAMLHAGAPGRHYDMQTVAHNAVLIYMADEEMPNGAVNSGGQRRYPSDAKLLAFESDCCFAYMATDATPVYHTNKCAEMIRQFIFLPPNHFVVFDRVVSRRAEYPKIWLLHTANEPAIRGREFSAVQGQGKIFCRTLLPEDAAVHAVGGPGREFWAGNRNWAIPPSLPKHWLRGILDEDGHVCEQVGRWRIEVRPGSAREQDHFLHLIEVGNASAAAMAACELIDAAGCAGVRFKVGTREYTVSLNKTGEVGGEIRIAAEGRILVDRAFTNDVMPQHGLALMDACPRSVNDVQSAAFVETRTDKEE